MAQENRQNFSALLSGLLSSSRSVWLCLLRPTHPNARRQLMKWILTLLMLLALGCESPKQVRQLTPEPVVNKRKPVIRPIDLDYEPEYSEPGQYLFISRSVIEIVDFEHDIRRGVIQLATNRPVLAHRATAEIRGESPVELVMSVGEYETQTHLSLSFSRVSLPKSCHIHITLVYADQSDSVIFKLEGNSLTHRGYLVLSKRAP